MKHTRSLVEMYQRLMPDTSQTLQAIAARCLAEVEEAEMQAARIAELEAALDMCLTAMSGTRMVHQIKPYEHARTILAKGVSEKEAKEPR